MVQVIQELRSKNPLELAQYADDVVASMTGNANFATPTPALSQIQAKAAAIRAGQTRVATAETNLSNERAAVRSDASDLRTLLTNAGTYVQGMANADGHTDDEATVIVKSADMDVKSSGTPIGMLPAPIELSLANGNTGEITARCHSVKNAGLYQWEKCVEGDPNTGLWTIVTSTTKASAHLPGFASGTLPWIRVRAGHGDMLGPASAPVSIRVV